MPVAQLDRVSDSDSEGRAFESHQAYHFNLASLPTGGLHKNRGIAQQVEQRSPKPRVPSSILGAPAIKSPVNLTFTGLFVFEKVKKSYLGEHMSKKKVRNLGLFSFLRKKEVSAVTHRKKASYIKLRCYIFQFLQKVLLIIKK